MKLYSVPNCVFPCPKLRFPMSLLQNFYGGVYLKKDSETEEGKAMYCPKCGKENVGNGKFCSSCGAPLPQKSVENVQSNRTKPMSQAVSAQPGKVKKGRKSVIVVAILAVVVLIAGGVYYFTKPKGFEGTVKMETATAVVFSDGLNPGDIMNIKRDGKKMSITNPLETNQGTIESVEETKDGYQYTIKDVSVQINGEETSISPSYVLVNIPKGASKGKLAGEHAIREMRHAGHSEDNSLVASCGSGSGTKKDKDKLKAHVRDWDMTNLNEEDTYKIDSTGKVVIPGYVWKENGEGRYIGTIDGTEIGEITIRPK